MPLQLLPGHQNLARLGEWGPPTPPTLKRQRRADESPAALRSCGGRRVPEGSLCLPHATDIGAAPCFWALRCQQCVSSPRQWQEPRDRALKEVHPSGCQNEGTTDEAGIPRSRTRAAPLSPACQSRKHHVIWVDLNPSPCPRLPFSSWNRLAQFVALRNVQTHRMGSTFQ